MIILGIDPGTATTGWGVVEKKGHDLICRGVGVVTTAPTLAAEKRLAIIYKDIKTLLKRYKPDAVAIEQLFFNTNAKTALLVGQARGVVMLSVAQKNLPLFSYTPLQVKVAITGYGRAEKKQIQEMVKTILKLEKIPKPDDAADALAIALTHCFSS